MSEHQKQASFLKTLLTYNEDTEEHRALQERLAMAAREEKCLQRACKLVGFMALFSLAGLGYCFVLLPGFLNLSRHTLVMCFAALALGCAIALAIFGGLWLWNRSVSHHLHGECRKLITSFVHSRVTTAPPPTVLIQENKDTAYRARTLSAAPDSGTEIITLHKAS